LALKPQFACPRNYNSESDEDVIGIDGVESLCKDLEVDPSDKVMLVMAYHLGAQKMAEFTRDGWIKVRSGWIELPLGFVRSNSPYSTIEGLVQAQVRISESLLANLILTVNILTSRCDTMDKMKHALPMLRAELEDEQKFKDVYQFTFNFSRSEGQKSLRKLCCGRLPDTRDSRCPFSSTGNRRGLLGLAFGTKISVGGGMGRVCHGD
jgi:DCN1-like protein 1/2